LFYLYLAISFKRSAQVRIKNDKISRRSILPHEYMNQKLTEMKRSSLFAMLLCACMALNAQNIPQVQKSVLNTMVTVDHVRPSHTMNPFMNHEVNMVSNKAMLDPFETELGETFYDLQSNASINNRFQVWDDGTMAAVWTRGLEAAAFNDRGTGYNFFDGSSWGDWPTQRIETRRTGWPSISAWGTGGEVVVAHNGVEGLEWLTRDEKGTGAWTQTNFLGPAGIENDITWPRMITSGDNNEIIHLFVNSYVAYMNQPQALLYSRSDDGGQTWAPHHVILDGMGDDHYFELGADDYVLAAQGNTIAMLYSSDWADMFMMKSDDNGDSWEKTVIWEHPYPFFDWNTTVTDTFFSVCNAANIALDPDGMAHVVFAINRVAHFELGTTYNLWPYYDGIGYWNESMQGFSNDVNALAPPQYGYANSEMVEDVNYIGWMQDVDGDGVVTLNTGIMYYQQHGPSTMPTIGINDLGNIYVIFSSTTETYVTEEFNYKHLWFRAYENGSWGGFTDLSESIVHIFDECYYPVIGDVSGQVIHYIYNADISPGLAWSDDHAWQQNRIIHSRYDIPVAIGEEMADGFAFGLNPNPARDRAVVSLELEGPANVVVTITSLNGQKVREVNRKVQGGHARIGVDLGGLPPGTYLCRVQAGGHTANSKLIVY